jgi:hypothetical protein
MLQTAILIPLLAASAPAVDTSAPVEQNIMQVQDGGEEVGALDIYFPVLHYNILLDQAPLEPEVAENVWVLLILGVVLGPINAFLPDLMLPEGTEVHEDFMMEQLIGGLIGIPFFYLGGAPGAYIEAIGFVSRLDRNIKKSRGKPPASWDGSLTPEQPAVATMAF